jgi:sodium transport system permease protein
MNRFSRINTIWRKELIDTLRDRRTVIAMVLVPMVLYPALMLGSLQAIEVQVGSLRQEEYVVAVSSPEARDWLSRMAETDVLRRPPESPAEPARRASPRAGVREKPPAFRLLLVEDVARAVNSEQAHVGLLFEGPPPQWHGHDSTALTVLYDESDIRAAIAAAGLTGMLQRASDAMVQQRLRQHGLPASIVQPIRLTEHNVASAQKMAGSALGQIVPLILVIMTITGAIYPAIDLTAGERERGTLETLMVAPVPTLDLITGKFIVVTLVGLLSAVLNLVSIGGTIYLGGLGELLAPGSNFVLPLAALPWILLLLVPLAVMFSATLLAVCSFARSFKEAQNYVVPVMIAAMIPGVVGVLPGTRLEGPIVVMPVANVVVLTRELFMGRFDYHAIAWVLLSTSLYASAAIAVAARLFGQEAVLFADAGSIRTLFQRRFFLPRLRPTAATALLMLAVVYTLNFFAQQAIERGNFGGLDFLAAIGATLMVLLAAGPLLIARYMRISVSGAFALRAPSPLSLLAALCIGTSTWVLVHYWYAWQQTWMPLDPEVAALISERFAFLNQLNPWVVVFFLATIPALSEELFFRGFVLSGLRDALDRWSALLISSLAFGLFHYSAHRMIGSVLMGLLLGLLVLQTRSIWPALLAHLLFNGLNLLSRREDVLRPWLTSAGFDPVEALPPVTWGVAAAALLAVGLMLLFVRRWPASDQPSTGARAGDLAV